VRRARMTPECEFLDRCGFLKKYGPTEDSACRWFIREYCQGRKMNNCKRKEYLLKRGQPPSDDMMPTGQSVRTP
jgi:hypothetical protein